MQNRKHTKAKIVTKLRQIVGLSSWAMNLWNVLAFLVDLG